MREVVSAAATSPDFPAKRVTLGVAAMIALVATSSFLTWRVGEQLRTVMSSQISVLTAAERVEHYGTVLELSIKAVVTTGDKEAAARYRTVQPQLRSTLHHLRDEIQLTSNKAAVTAVDQADLSLIAMEYKALGLASRGNLAEARSVIHSPKYDRLLKIYYDGVTGIKDRADAYLTVTEEKVDWYLSAILALSCASFGLLLVGWLTVIRPARIWGAKLNQAHKQAADAVARLEESRAELQSLNQRFFDQARVDPLTKVHTRLKFNEDVLQLWSRADRYREQYCAIMCDIDQFKQYNDIFGHLEGDTALKRVAGALSAASRAGDQIYRLGGEEFVIILPSSSWPASVLAAERYRAAVEALALPHSGSATGVVTVSMGVAMLESTAGMTVESWLGEADAALYRAKRSGRNKVEGGGAGSV